MDSLNALSLLTSQVDFLEEMCFNRTEDGNIFEDFKLTVEECEAKILNGSNVAFTYSALESSNPDEFYAFYTSQCTNQSGIKIRNECNNDIKHILMKCLNETEIESFKKIEDIATRIFNAVCNFDQDKMRRFFSAKGQECLSDNVITIGFCFLSAMPESEEEKQELLLRDHSSEKGDECKVIDDFEKCMMEEINICDEKSISEIFQLMFGFFKHELNCIDVPEEPHQISGSASTNVFSIILLAILFIALHLY
ncbi:CLUMA_CG017998, isoform A [Clunio marinus]|uniref:CLUMA_CG017998, isoform A n=1 Tax=Clunio marinus TaxID=568069 RepID=A0A1J1IXX1_9DIPT|nr:CLUMA_CG017998, isoform A [Clunio marinus]